jgi:hypothetical protein
MPIENIYLCDEQSGHAAVLNQLNLHSITINRNDYENEEFLHYAAATLHGIVLQRDDGR